MNSDQAVVSRTLELVSERCGDPADLVFARLFREQPEVEALFVRDTAGLVRGQMLATVLDGFLDVVSDQAYAAALVEIERVNHVGLGVEPAVFDTFFRVVVDTFREVIGPDWTAEMEKVWARVLVAMGAAPSVS
jgi:hemoglobin-like flavoprotein